MRWSPEENIREQYPAQWVDRPGGLDAGREQLPKGFRGPTDRDVLFLTKADVIILLWNGKSQGTREMIDWYRSNEKDHVVGFVGEKR